MLCSIYKLKEKGHFPSYYSVKAQLHNTWRHSVNDGGSEVNHCLTEVLNLQVVTDAEEEEWGRGRGRGPGVWSLRDRKKKKIKLKPCCHWLWCTVEPNASTSTGGLAQVGIWMLFLHQTILWWPWRSKQNISKNTRTNTGKKQKRKPATFSLFWNVVFSESSLCFDLQGHRTKQTLFFNVNTKCFTGQPSAAVADFEFICH